MAPDEHQIVKSADGKLYCIRIGDDLVVYGPNILTFSHVNNNLIITLMGGEKIHTIIDYNRFIKDWLHW